MRKLVLTLHDAEREFDRDSPFPEGTLRPYFEQIEEHERSVLEASNRGKRIVGAQKKENRTVKDRTSKPRQSGEESDSDDEDSADEEPNDRAKPETKPSYPWETSGFIHSAILTEMHIQVNRDLELFTHDVSVARQSLLNTLGCPPFPYSEWTNILKGRAVNLDVVYSEAYSVTVDDHETFAISEGISLKVGKPKQSSKIVMHGEWAVAWAAYARAMLFIFPYRQGELNEYQIHITNLFGSQHVSVHHRVLNYDRAVRIFIGQQRSVLFNEVSKYSHLKYAHIDSTGAAVMSTSSGHEYAGGPSRRAKTTKRRGKEICQNYNVGKCRFTKEQCKYAHLCGECGANGHIQDSCPNKGKHDA